MTLQSANTRFSVWYRSIIRVTSFHPQMKEAATLFPVILSRHSV